MLEKSRRTFASWMGGVTVSSLLLSSIFYPFTLTALANFLALSQQPERADLILVLGGDFWGPRALLGADLGTQGYAPKVMINGPPYRSHPESDLSIRFLEEKGYRKDLFISFPIYAKSTIGEAIAVCPELERRGSHTVLIVTSAYHSRRANLVLRLFCPGIRFRSIAAPDDQFQPENWWKTPRYRTVFFSEWEKIVATVLWEYPKHKLTLLMARWSTKLNLRIPSDFGSLDVDLHGGDRLTPGQRGGISVGRKWIFQISYSGGFARPKSI